MNEEKVEELIKLIEEKMNGGVSRLSIQFTDAQEEGTKTEKHHHGRCDIGSPWATGAVGNCDIDA